jgi:hypothetical protein
MGTEVRARGHILALFSAGQLGSPLLQTVKSPRIEQPANAALEISAFTYSCMALVPPSHLTLRGRVAANCDRLVLSVADLLGVPENRVVALQ